MDKIIASALKSIPHLTAILDVTEEAIKSIDLKPVLMYLIDTTSAESLPYLAAQFDVLGYKGWALTTTEQEQRELLKKAIELHRYKGTPWSIKEALKSVGFGVVEIDESVSEAHSGVYYYDGSIVYDTDGLYDWALFSVIVDLGETKGLTDDQITLATRIINEYKPVRSMLVGVNFTITMSDIATINDDALAYQREITPEYETLNGITYNGSSYYSGANNHTSTDNATVVVRNSLGNITQTFNF